MEKGIKGTVISGNLQNDELLLDTIRLIHLLTRLDNLTIMKKDKIPYKLLKNLISILEWDTNNPDAALAFRENRRNFYLENKTIEKKNFF